MKDVKTKKRSVVLGKSRVGSGASLESIAIGGLAQLARAPALQAGGQRFESVILHLRRMKILHLKKSTLTCWKLRIERFEGKSRANQKTERTQERRAPAPKLKGDGEGVRRKADEVQSEKAIA